MKNIPGLKQQLSKKINLSAVKLYLIYFLQNCNFEFLFVQQKSLWKHTPRHEWPLACVFFCRHRAPCSRVWLQFAAPSVRSAFSPSLKAWGILQGWCVILAPFVCSIRIWEIPACCDVCCACSGRSDICTVKSLQLRSHVPLFSKL